MIPVHNKEDIIESKLLSVKNVSYPKENIEVIVAEDASRDKTLRALIAVAPTLGLFIRIPDGSEKFSELWLYNMTARSFRYHNRFVGI